MEYLKFCFFLLRSTPPLHNSEEWVMYTQASHWREIKAWSSPPGFFTDNLDKLVKSQKTPIFVIPAKAGIQETEALVDSRLRGNDELGDFLQEHHLGP